MYTKDNQKSTSQFVSVNSLIRPKSNVRFPEKAKETSVQTKLEVSRPGDPAEIEADRIADKVMRMSEPMGQEKTEKSPAQISSSSVGIQRKPQENKVEEGRPRQEIIGSQEKDHRLFMRWLEKRVDVIPKTKPKIMEKFKISISSRVFQENTDTISSEWSIGGEAGISASYKFLSGAIKGGYKKSWKTEDKTGRREEKSMNLDIPIKVLSREVDRKEISKYWSEWKRYVGRVEGTNIAVVEVADELEKETDLGNINELGFEIEEPDDSKRQFWPKYYYGGPSETLATQAPYEEDAASEAVWYIHERAEKFTEYVKLLFEKGL